MIIWSRWGFLSFLAIGASVAVVLPILNVFSIPDVGTHIGAMIFTSTALINLALARWAYPRLDRPRQITITRPLPAPYTWPNGSVQTHEVVPALDPEGNQLFAYPRSTLFFIPARYIWMLFAGGALILWVVTIANAVRA